MEIMYVDRRPRRLSETMMLKANVEPRLIRHRIPVKIEVRYTELNGMFHLKFI